MEVLKPVSEVISGLPVNRGRIFVCSLEKDQLGIRDGNYRLLGHALPGVRFAGE